MNINNEDDIKKPGERPNSKVDELAGKHTTSLIVAILFIITLIGLILVVCIKDGLPDSIFTGLISLLGVFAGFFAGTNMKK